MEVEEQPIPQEWGKNRSKKQPLGKKLSHPLEAPLRERAGDETCGAQVVQHDETKVPLSVKTERLTIEEVRKEDCKTEALREKR